MSNTYTFLESCLCLLDVGDFSIRRAVGGSSGQSLMTAPTSN
jgi:hypothetical protein